MQHLFKHRNDLMHPFPTVSFSTNVYDNPADIIGSVWDLGVQFDAVEFEVGEDAEEVFWAADVYGRLSIARKLRDICELTATALSVHAGWYGRQYNLCSADENERESAVELLIQTAFFAEEAGALTITFHPGYRDDLDRTTLLNNLIDSINRVQFYLPDDFSAFLCLENMGSERPRYPVFSVEEHVEFARRTGAWITVDLIHLCSLFPFGSKLDRAIDAIAPVTRHLHIADMVGMKHQHLPLGEGNLPLIDILNRFACNGYKGAAVVEEFIRKWPTAYYLDCAVKFRDQLQALLAN